MAHLIFKNGNTHRSFFAALSFDDGELRVLASAIKAFDFALNPQPAFKRLAQDTFNNVEKLANRQRACFVAHCIAEVVKLPPART